MDKNFSPLQQKEEFLEIESGTTSFLKPYFTKSHNQPSASWINENKFNKVTFLV